MQTSDEETGQQKSVMRLPKKKAKAKGKLQKGTEPTMRVLLVLGTREGADGAEGGHTHTHTLTY